MPRILSIPSITTWRNFFGSILLAPEFSFTEEKELSVRTTWLNNSETRPKGVSANNLLQQFHKSALGEVHFITWFLIILKIAMFCVTASIILSSKYRCIFLLFVLEFVMNHKNETGNITTEKSFSTEVEKLVRASYENNWKIDVEPLSFVYWAHPPPPRPPPQTGDKPTRVLVDR